MRNLSVQPQLSESMRPFGGDAMFLPLAGVAPALPFQFPSLAHFDERIRAALSFMEKVDGLQPTTRAWVENAYRSFRTFLLSGAERRFLPGDVRLQARVLEEWIAWMRERGLSRVTMNNYWRGMRLLCKRIEQQDGMLNPFRLTPAPRYGRRIPACLTREAAGEILRFVHEYPLWGSTLARARNAAVVGIMLLAGLRRSEVLRLRVIDIQLEADAIRVLGAKGRFGGKDRTAYMPPQLAELLTAYRRERELAKRETAAYFTSVVSDVPMGVVAISHIFRIVTKKLGMRVTPHMLRHTYATLLRQSGVPDRLSMELLGHTSLQMLQRYSHVFNGETHDAAQRLRLDIRL